MVLMYCNVSFAIDLNCTLKKSEPLGEEDASDKKSKEEVIGSKAEMKLPMDQGIFFMKDQKRGLRKFEIEGEDETGVDGLFIDISENIITGDSVWIGISTDLNYFLALRNIHIVNETTKKTVSVHIEYHCQKK